MLHRFYYFIFFDGSFVRFWSRAASSKKTEFSRKFIFAIILCLRSIMPIINLFSNSLITMMQSGYGWGLSDENTMAQPANEIWFLNSCGTLNFAHPEPGGLTMIRLSPTAFSVDTCYAHQISRWLFHSIEWVTWSESNEISIHAWVWKPRHKIKQFRFNFEINNAKYTPTIIHFVLVCVVVVFHAF